VKTGRKKEIESNHGAQESPVLRKGERQRKNYGEREQPWRAGEPCFEEGRKTEKELRRERERGKLQSKRQRHRTQERGKDREYNVTRAAHISTQWNAVTARLS